MLYEQISKDYIQAMKAKDSVKSSSLNFLRAQLKNILIDQKLEKLEDKDVIAVIKKQVKQRQDSIDQFRQGGREDLVQKESEELAVLKAYLPEEMSEQEIENVVAEAVRETGASSMKEMGTVMKAVSAKVAGRADNKLVSELVKKALMQT